MNAPHLHLLLNHFPIIGTLLGLGVMFFGFLRRSDDVKITALWIWLIMGILAIPVLLTGEPAEEAVEGLAGVSENFLHEHEEAGETAFWIVAAAGLLSLFALFRFRSKPAWLQTMVLITTLVAGVGFASMAYTGYLGGKIRHSEIRGAQNGATTTDLGLPEREEHEDDD